MNVRTPRNLLFAVAAALVLVLLSGCSTINSRIQDNAAYFNTLPLDTQERIRKGIVEVGDTADMVYIALGRPGEKRSTRSASRDRETWIYKVHYSDWVGRVFLGYRRVVVYDEKTKKTYVYREPVYEDVYRERTEERIRIEFDRGAVTAIEQRK